MNSKRLVDAIVRQTTVLLAEIATLPASGMTPRQLFASLKVEEKPVRDARRRAAG
jgi:hypothetical protein